MKDKVVNSSINLIKTYYNFDDIQLKRIKYGFEGIYITLTKLIVNIIIAILLGTVKETIIFILIYIPIKSFGFGIHATKSWMCWLTLIPIFCGIPYLCKILTINHLVLFITSIISAILISIFAPADTKKRPLKNSKKRKEYKIGAIIVSIIYITYIYFNNNIISKAMFFALILEAIIINPLTYKLFKQPYNNYKLYK